ncbi:MAG: HEAT repeat domain-containing protein [Nitrospirae bacterium]|nr:HEAT repeat domain-containing protein [Nitrospirota bacterium]
MTKKALMVLLIISVLAPAIAFAGDKVDEKIAMILDSRVGWMERVKLMDEVAPAGIPKVKETLANVFYDSMVNFGCPSMLYHAVSGLRYFPYDSKAIEVAREGMGNREPLVRMISIEVLGMIGSENDIDYLRPFLASRHSFESSTAQVAIDTIIKRTRMVEKKL